MERTLPRLWYEMTWGETRLVDLHPDTVPADPVFLIDSDGASAQKTEDRAFVDGLRQHVPPFAPVTYEWHGGDREDRSGGQVITMPWVNLDEAGRRLIRFAHIVRPFVWHSPESKARLGPVVLAGREGTHDGPMAGPTQDLWDAILALARNDRFNEGALASESHALTRCANEIRRRILYSRRRLEPPTEPIPLPELIPYREPIDPRNVRAEDSGLSVLETVRALDVIYREAYERRHSQQRLLADFPDRNAFIAAIPSLIQRHNL